MLGLKLNHVRKRAIGVCQVPQPHTKVAYVTIMWLVSHQTHITLNNIHFDIEAK